MSADERVFWRSDTRCGWVSNDGEGALVFTGEERAYLGERTWLADHGIGRGFRCH